MKGEIKGFFCTLCYFKEEKAEGQTKEMAAQELNVIRLRNTQNFNEH